jgi:DNA-binding CsgD family transcriptional regulator
MTSEISGRVETGVGWTPRQRQVLDLLVRGYTNGEIGQALGISLDGAKWHVSEVMGKLGVSSREGAAAYWRAYNRPAARLGRGFRGLVLSPGLRWAAGAVGVATGATLLAVLLVLARGGDSSPAAADATPATTSTPSSSPTSAATVTPTTAPTPEQATPVPALASGVWPRGTNTGIPIVDEVIQLVESKDARGLAKLVEPLTYPCEAMRPINPQPLLCREGMSVGDPLSGIWATSVEGGLWPGDPAELTPRLEFVLRENFRLHAVWEYQRSDPTVEWLPGVRYSVIFAYGDPQLGIAFTSFNVSETGFIWLAFDFPTPPPGAWDDPSAPGWILPRAD